MGTPRLATHLGLVAAVLATALVAAGPTPGASADIHRPLRGDFYDLAVDEANGRIFLSTGPRAEGLVVTDLKGRNAITVEGLRGTTGLAFSADRSELYVGLFNEQAIAIVDPATLTVAKRAIPNADGESSACPRDLEVLDGAVWFVDQCARGYQNGYGRLRSYTPATRRTTSHPGFFHPRLTTDAASNSLFVRVADSYISIYAFDVARTAARTLTTRAEFRWAPGDTVPHDCYSHAYLGDPTVVPGTNEILTANGFFLDRDELIYRRHFECLQYEPSMDYTAARADGMLAFSFGSPSNVFAGTPDVVLVRPGQTTHYRAYFFKRALERQPAHIVEWGANNLYQLAWTWSRRDKSAYLRVIAPRPPSVLSIRTRFRGYDIGDRVRVNIRFSSNAAPPRRVVVYHGDRTGVGVYRDRVRLDGSGRGVFSFRMPDWSYPTYLMDAKVVDRGDVVRSNRLQLRVR